MEETARTYLGLPHNATTMKLYKNMKNGTFKDVTAEVGLDKVFMPMGANFGDIDNDGFLDIYLGTGNPSYGSLVPNVLLRNHDGKYFVDVTASSGTGELHKGHGSRVCRSGKQRQRGHHCRSWRGHPGRQSCHAGVRKSRQRQRLDQSEAGGHEKQSLRHRRTHQSDGGEPRPGNALNLSDGGSGGSFGASPLQQHIGLGKDARIVDVEIWWPASNTRQHFANVDKDQFLEIKEFATDYAKLDRPVIRLGGARRDDPALAKQHGPEREKKNPVQ